MCKSCALGRILCTCWIWSCLNRSLVWFKVLDVLEYFQFGSSGIFRIADVFVSPNFVCFWLKVLVFLVLLLRLLLVLKPVLFILIRILILRILVMPTRISTTRLSLLTMKYWQGSNPQSFFSLIATSAVLVVLVLLYVPYTDCILRLIFV